VLLVLHFFLHLIQLILEHKEIENVEQGQNCEYTCKICRNNKEKTSMLATEFPKRNISSNIDILGEGSSLLL
jgi:hypothetical protein